MVISLPLPHQLDNNFKGLLTITPVVLCAFLIVS